MNVKSRVFPVSLIDSLFKTIFQVKVWYELNKVYLPGDLYNECAHSRLPQCHQWMAFHDHLVTETIVSSQKFCLSGDGPDVQSPRRPEQWMYTAEALPASSRYDLFKTTFQVGLLYCLNEICLLENHGRMCRGFLLSVTNAFTRPSSQ